MDLEDRAADGLAGVCIRGATGEQHEKNREAHATAV
jgi:hypothetical protein